MKTIIFFARASLTEMYGEIYVAMQNEYNIVFVAYSDKEEETLKNKFSIKNVVNFKDLLNEKLIDTTLDYAILNEIDRLIIEMTDDRFRLNSSIQSDRGMALLSYEESLLLVQSYYLIWQDLFRQYNVNFFIHEFVSLSMNHIASVVCQKHNALYITEMQVRGLNKFNLLLMNFDAGIPIELNNEYNILKDSDIDENIAKINKFINTFKKDNKVLFSHLGSARFRILKLIIRAIKDELCLILRKNKFDKLKDNIDYYLLRNRGAFSKIVNLISYKLLIRWDSVEVGKNYYFYPLHLEPEAVVNYLADGIYRNQIQLIENIAGQLPVDTYLYVKDHPHDIGYRSVSDYLRLKVIPNVKLVHAKESSKSIIQNSIGVITLNGTAGFEAMLLGKKVFTFGKAFYSVSPLAVYVHNVRDLKDSLESTCGTVKEMDYYLKKFILALIKSSYIGNTDCFYGASNKYRTDPENIENLKNSYKSYFDKMAKIAQ